MKPDVSKSLGRIRHERHIHSNNNKARQRYRVDRICIVFLQLSLIGMVLWTFYSHNRLQQHESRSKQRISHLQVDNTIYSKSQKLNDAPQKQSNRRMTTASATTNTGPKLRTSKEDPPKISVLENDLQENNAAPTGKDDKSSRSIAENDLPEITAYHTAVEKDKDTPASSSSSSSKIPIFYSLYVKDESYKSQVKDSVKNQLEMMIPDVHGPVFVNSMGTALDIPNTVLVRHHDNDHGHDHSDQGAAVEMASLQSLWEFCREPINHNSSVVYLHSKWSHHPSMQTGKIRRFITKGALSRECSTIAEEKNGDNATTTCNVCGSRFTPVPHPHSRGNMWLARCSYVKDLIAPEEFSKRMEEHHTSIVDEYEGDKETYAACDGRRGRAVVEHWVHSHPNVKPCDLYKDKKFTWNFDKIPSTQDFVDNIDLQPAPRFELEEYFEPLLCPGRGTSLEDRLNEYKALYKKDPADTWWGYNFLRRRGLTFPYHKYGWRFLPESRQSKLDSIGYNERMWDNIPRIRPFEMYGRHWEDFTPIHRSVIEESLEYKRPTWEREIKTDTFHMEMVKNAVATKVPIENAFDRCSSTTGEMKVWKDRNSDPNAKSSLREYIYEADPNEQIHGEKKKRLLIISAVPRDKTHILSLWSELECFTINLDHVVISAPEWGRPFIEKVIDMAKQYIPQFLKAQVTIEPRFYVNNRYDVGLWCDALETLRKDGQDKGFDEFGLINDSVYALRPFSGVFDNIGHMDVHMTSLSYSLTAKGMRKYGKQHYWVESVFRGFDKKGIDIFIDHSCVPEDHPSFCPEEEDNKACIINNFEHDLALKYPCKKVHGIYPSDLPENLGKPREIHGATWIKKLRYWRLLVQQMGFPIAKLNEPDQVGSHSDMLLKNCTKHYPPPSEMFDGMKFEVAKPYYQQEWNDLTPSLRTAASETLGYEEAIWDSGKTPNAVLEEKWDKLSDAQRGVLTRLGCTKMMYNRRRCRRVIEVHNELE